jgi:hypothetical protein
MEAIVVWALVGPIRRTCGQRRTKTFTMFVWSEFVMHEWRVYNERKILLQAISVCQPFNRRLRCVTESSIILNTCADERATQSIRNIIVALE